MLDPRLQSETPGRIRTLLKAGFQNQKQAEVALLFFAALCIVFSIWMITPRKELPAQNDPQQNPNYQPTASR